MLTPKQKKFCDEYLIDLNATQAAIRAGYSAKTAKEQAARLLTNVNVEKYIQEKRNKIADKLDLSVERILKEYSRIGFFDIRKAFNDDGQLKPVADLDDDTAAAIAGIETYEELERAGEETFVKGLNRKIKVSDKRAALDSICKVLGYNSPEKREHEHKISNVPVIKIERPKKRSA